MTDMTVALTLKAFDQLSPVVGKAASNLSKAFRGIADQSGLNLVGATLGNLSAKLSAVGEAARGLTIAGGVGTLGALFAGGQFAAGVIRTSATFEALGVRLKALEGSSDGAQRALSWITQFAKDTPLQLQEVVQAYAQLRTFGLDPTDGTLQKLTDTMAKSGGGAEMLQGLILGVGQAWTKGKLQGEEALQLIERGVPVWDLLAKATGKSAAALQDLSSKGKLGRQEISLLIDMMGKSAQGASADYARTWDGIISNLEDSWTRFQKMVGDAGAFSALKSVLQDILQAVGDNDGAVAEFANGLGREFAAGISAAAAAVRELVSGQGGMAALGQTIGRGVVDTLKGLLGVLRDFGGAVKWVHDQCDSWTPVLAGIGLIIAGPLISGIASLTAALIPLGVALAATPLGAFVLAIGAAITAGTLLYENWSTLQAKFGAFLVELGLIDPIISAARAVSDAWESVRAKLSAVWDSLSAAWQKVRGFFGGGTAGVTAATIAPAMPGGGATQHQVGGEINLRIEGAPRGTRVTGLQSRGGIAIGAEMGPYAPAR